MTPFQRGLYRGLKAGVPFALIFFIGCLIGLTMVAGDTLRELTATLKASQSTLAESQKSIQLIREHADRVLTEAGLTAASLRKTALEAEKASVEQRKYWAQSSEQITVTIQNLNAAILHTDESVNRQLFPVVIEAVQDSRKIATSAAKSIDDVNAELKPVLENAALMSGNAAKLLSDPAITESLQHINESTAHLEATSQRVEETAASLELYAKRITKPASLAMRALSTVGAVLGSFAVLIKGIL